MGFRVVAKAPAQMSAGEDVAASAGSGLLQGAMGTLGLAGDMSALAKSLPGKGAEFLERHGVVKPGTAKGFQDYLGAATHFTPLDVGAGLLRGGYRAAAEGAGLKPQDAARASSLIQGPSSATTTQAIEAASGADQIYHKPQTKAGEYARTIGQFAPAAATGGGLARRAANVALPAVASETAGQFTKGTKVEPYARVLAALLTGGGVALADRPPPPPRLLAEASRGATDAHVAAARALQEQAQARGVQLTQAEALQQVTGGATGLGRLQSVVEATPSGAEHMGPVMARRPGQARAAALRLADNIAPPSSDPYMLGRQAQEAAGDVQTGVRQQINANARPFYDALAGEHMPTAAPGYQELVQNPAYQEALGQVRGNPVLNGPIAQLPDHSLAVVNEVVKQLDTLATNARPNPASSTGNAQMSAAYDAARNQADQLASATSEPWRLSRAMVASGREAFLEPLQAGPMGAISKTPQIGGQTRALFPDQPAEGAPAATAQALEMLPREVSGGLTRQHLVNALNEATQDLQGGPNQWGGARFAANIAGNPEQRQTLMAGVGAAGGNPADMESLVNVLAATGKRHHPGSMTAYNLEALKTMGQGGSIGEVAKAVASGPAMFRKFGDAMERWQQERNAADLAQTLLAEPAQAERTLMQARGRVGPEALIRELERLALTSSQGRLGSDRPQP